MNSVLTQLPKAQEAYQDTLAYWVAAGINTATLLVTASTNIREAVAKGLLGTYVGGIEDIRTAEKLAIELAGLGYAANCVANGQAQQPDGSIRPIHAVSICWKWMPANSRDAYTI